MSSTRRCVCPPLEQREEPIRSYDLTIVAYQCRTCRRLISTACPHCRKIFDEPRKHVPTCPARPTKGGSDARRV